MTIEKKEDMKFEYWLYDGEDDSPPKITYLGIYCYPGSTFYFEDIKYVVINTQMGSFGDLACICEKIGHFDIDEEKKRIEREGKLGELGI